MIYEKIKKELERAEYWVGLDVGKNGAVMYVLQTGKDYYIRKPRDIYAILKNKRAVVLVENTGIYSYWFESLNSTVKVFMINGIRSKAGKLRKGIRKKNDIRDAVNLAKILKDIADAKNEVEFMELPPVMETMPEEQRYVRFLIKVREQVRRDVNRWKNRIEKVIFLYGWEKRLHGYGESILKVLEALEKMHVEDWYVEKRKEHLLRQKEHIRRLIEYHKEIDDEIREIIARHPDYQKLKAVKGLGEEFIQFLIAMYWDINRFPTADAFKSYFKIHYRYDEESSQWKGKGKRRFKNGLLKKYMHLMIMKRRYWDVELQKAYEYYKNTHKNKYAKALNKFTGWLFRKLYFYLKEGRPIRFGG